MVDLEDILAARTLWRTVIPSIAIVVEKQSGHITGSFWKMPGVSFNVDPEIAKITEIERGLYISGVSGLTPENIEKYDISLIINATAEVPNVRSLGNVPRIKLWLEDTPQTSIYPLLDAQANQIEEVTVAGGSVLVHCVAGVSRSASICLAYLTKFRCKSLRDAYFLMASKRPLVRPNIGFWRQLISYEQDVKQCLASVRLVHNDEWSDQIIPDVYIEAADLSVASPKNAEESRRQRRRSSLGRLRFQPSLETVLELVEAAA